jgi:SAM-dependent methyltransferase
VAAAFDDQSYDAIYQHFESPLMQKVRHEAFGQDIGQHSWVTAEELEGDIPRLKLTRACRYLDLGCGPCGPLLFTVGRVGCHGSGVDVSAPAIAAGRRRASELGLEQLVTLTETDLNGPLPFESATFEAIVSFDVVIHLLDRGMFFREVARVLTPGGRFLFTDAGVVTGRITDEEMRLRTFHGHTQFEPAGFNEKMIEVARFRLVECVDRTANLLKNATGRIHARLNHQRELEQLEGSVYFQRQQRYLETVVGLAQRRAVARMMYLVEPRGA